MITLNKMTIKNFISVGNTEELVNFTNSNLTLILGNNLDLGGDGNRNGVGKTTIINAISYVIFGDALMKIRKDNLVNKTNEKKMMVTLDFQKNGDKYRIERGRKPATLKFFINEIEDEAQGENKETQVQIENIFGMSHEMFKHIGLLTTYTQPFLDLKASEQREIIEQLFGITILSEKAELLKVKLKDTKDSIKEEEFRIKAINESNMNISNSIQTLINKQLSWKNKQINDIKVIEENIVTHEALDIDNEINSHNQLKDFLEKEMLSNEANIWLSNIINNIEKLKKTLIKLDVEIKSLEGHECYTCGQKLHDDKQESILLSKRDQVKDVTAQILDNEGQEKIWRDAIKNLGEMGVKPKTHYKNIQLAVEHQNTINNLKNELIRISEDVDTYQDQIDILKETAIKEIDLAVMNDLTSLKDHQDCLLKLLSSNNSFIRKEIIEQNLQFLNNRLSHYLIKLGLPHKVTFLNDLSVDIAELGRELDFDNLSRGERNRLILGLSLSFRDVFEIMHMPINILAIDELIDSGMDAAGVESCLAVLKEISRTQNKHIFLISHKDELINKVDSLLHVVKEGGFTTFNDDI